jgi:hypothetical protein
MRASSSKVAAVETLTRVEAEAMSAGRNAPCDEVEVLADADAE